MENMTNVEDLSRLEKIGNSIQSISKSLEGTISSFDELFDKLFGCCTAEEALALQNDEEVPAGLISMIEQDLKGLALISERINNVLLRLTVQHLV